MARNGFTRFPNHLWESQLSPGAKLTYACISSFAWGSNTIAWPSQGKLATMTGYSDRSIRRFTEELEKAGLVTVERKAWSGNRYHLTGAEKVAAEPAKMSPDTGHVVLSTSETVSDKEDNSNQSRENNTELRSSEDMRSGVEKQSPSVRTHFDWEKRDSRLPLPRERHPQEELSRDDAYRLKELRRQHLKADLTDEELLTRPDENEDRDAYGAWALKLWRRRESERAARQNSGPLARR
jgi:hypothetical protein